MSQDIHFSQFYASPLTLNPANTGFFKGDWRVVNNYRRQWSAISIPYVTYAFSYDRQIYLERERLSMGLVFISDKSGNAALTVNKIYASVGFHKSLAGTEIHAGYQAGYVMKSFSMDNLTFPDQFDNQTGYFNAGLANNESLEQNLSYLDMNAGIAVSRPVGGCDVSAGFAIYHLNKPLESFYMDPYLLQSRKVFNASLKAKLNELVCVVPRLMIMGQTQASDLLAGSNITLKVPANRYKVDHVFGGALIRDGFNRNIDSFIAIAGFNFRNFELGFSYDVNISSLKKATNYRGGFELSLIYISSSSLRNKFSIPCERF